MAVKQSITVAIEPGLLKKARAVAVRRGRSVSALLADELRELVADDRAYVAAHRNAVSMLKTGFALEGARMQDRTEAHATRRIR